MNGGAHPVQPIAITGAGAVSPLGDRPAAIHAALCAGERAFAPITGFPVDGLAHPVAAEARFDPAATFGAVNLRPLDRTARLATAAAGLAIADAGWSAADVAARSAGLVLGTMFGSLRTISEFDRRAMSAGPIYASPLDFANSVINAAAGQVAIWHKLRGTNETIAGGPVAALAAIGHAADLVRAGRAAALLAGGAEELCFESLLGFERRGVLSTNGAPRPFDGRHGGFLLGEGAALFALETDAAGGGRVLGWVLGQGASFDPSRGRDADQAASAVGRACRAALADSGLEPQAIDAVSSSANGSPEDAVEARGLADVFGPRLAALPICAVKGQLGEALGAASAFQVLALLAAFGSGRFPGVPGLEEADAGSPLGPAQAAARDVVIRYGLVSARGFDGQSAALVLAAPAEGADA